MPHIERTKKQILDDVKRTLDTAELGYKILVQASPPDKMAGLMNLVVFGRAVTNVLQHLRGKEAGFDEWYNMYREEMKSDSLLKFFYDIRSEILKEGKLRVGTSACISHLSFPQDMARFPPPPKNAKGKGFFIGDRFGGSGYEIEMADGSVEKFYVNLPLDIAMVNVQFLNSPKTHLGKALTNDSVEYLSRLYLDYLQKMVKDAITKFGVYPLS